jgi:predicted AAA+ superfamily ATPase
MRQVGKTTIMHQIYDTIDTPKLWFDFENPLDAIPFEDIDYKSIYHKLNKLAGGDGERLTIFIDEIQNFPEITKIMKYHIDHYKVKYIVTGSSNYYLKNLFPESLSGRKFLFILNPLSFQEYLYFNDIIDIPSTSEVSIYDIMKNITLYEYKKFDKFYNDYLEYGGFPEVIVTADVETKKMILKNIFTSFFEKDIKILGDIKDVRELRDLILLLVPRVGSILDITKLASELGINRMKIYNYLEFLQGLFFVRLIPKYSKSIDRSVAGGKKVYFSDTGMLNIVGRVNDGQLFENVIANQLNNYGELSFYNYRGSSEIDFILNKEIAFEVKLNGSVHDLKRLSKLSSGLNLTDYSIISKSFCGIDKVVYPMFL